MKTGLEHILVPPRTTRKTDTRKRDDNTNTPSRRSPRAHVNVIPSTAELRDLIARATQALSRGMIWDRGAIINLVL